MTSGKTTNPGQEAPARSASFNVLAFSCRERAAQDIFKKAYDLAREAVSCNIP
jgi:hypothetical protein